MSVTATTPAGDYLLMSVGQRVGVMARFAAIGLDHRHIYGLVEGWQARRASCRGRP